MTQPVAIGTDTHSQTSIENPRLLRFVRGIWLAFMFVHLVIFAFAIPHFLSAQNRTFSTDHPWFYIIIDVFTIGGFLLFGSFIVARRSDNWMVLYSVWAMFFFGLLNCIVFTTFLNSNTELYIFRVLGVILLYSFMLVFPDGRLRPRWSLILIVGFIAWLITSVTIGDEWSSAYDVVDLLFILLAFAVSFYRYKHYFSPTRRQQTKWV
ncbi:MAG: hypothetical protein MUE54_06935, partial [Anaerolineae bacterium]|nr:hypothetical protein [Anaerolineae bacterium]